MTERLYYADPYRTQFVARVVQRLEWEGRPAVVLDRSAFYPTGGGQPHDTGWLNGMPVADVVEREENGPVVHVLSSTLEQDEVQGQVDWRRRFDHMQQHTGQHILSAVSLRVLGATTVGFHLSAGYSTVDLDRAPLGAEDLDRVEALANSAVFENRPVDSRFVSDEEIASLPLRKPVHHAGPVRVVQVQDLDCSACGGTHVRATGEIGLAKIVRTERRGSETRVEFLCGGRALKDYAAKNALLTGLAAEFTVSHWELPDLLRRQGADLLAARRELREARAALLEVEAAELWSGATRRAGGRVVTAVFPGRSADDLKHLAQCIVSRPETVALLGSGAAGEKASLVFARSAGVTANMGTLLRQACEWIGGRGGGRPELAQGGGPDGLRLAEALDLAACILAEQWPGASEA